jgi:hypothetical protein
MCVHAMADFLAPTPLPGSERIFRVIWALAREVGWSRWAGCWTRALGGRGHSQHSVMSMDYSSSTARSSVVASVYESPLVVRTRNRT